MSQAKGKSKPQILLIHGGMTFKNRHDYLNFLKTREISLESGPRWSKDYLDKKLGKKFEIIRPNMPLKDNACYEDWKIHFERYLPLLRSKAILIGSSLGGIFLAKYLAENKLQKKFLAVFLVSPPFDNSLPHEDLVGGFRLPSSLLQLENNCRHLYLLFSQQDLIVPVDQAAKYALKLKKANIKIYPHINGHFRVAELPELVNFIKKDLKIL
jgi:predicted alpha/beta hydrolase family esterase